MKTKEVIFFNAPEWDRASVVMKPVFKSVATEAGFKNLKFTDVDVETEFGVELSCKYQVRNVPTILVVNKGRVIDRIKGNKTREKLIKTLKKWK